MKKGRPSLTHAARRIVLRWRGECIMGTLWLMRQASTPHFMRFLKTPYHAMLRGLIRKTRLFDRAYYLAVNHDIAESGRLPLRHFVAYGDREGRWPMPLFDPHYYRARAGGRSCWVNSLLHYALVGRYRGISPSTWFDVRYYLGHNRDVVRSGMDPLLHYMQLGGQQGRSPNPQFDGSYYLMSNPDVRETGENPLLHYVQIGRHEGRPTREASALPAQFDHSDFLLPFTDKSVAGNWQALEARILPRSCMPQGALVDVVVPVYRDRALTWRCLTSVLTSLNETAFELIVIDDCSPEDELRAELKEMAERGWITLLRNEENLGFVATANLGMGLHPERDVVLLNSDAEVYDTWLDRLRQAAWIDDEVASVTPLSNNATICSYPRFLHDNPYPLEIDYPTLDRLTSQVNAGITVEAPTAVGFCMYVRRSAIGQVGLFDEDAFGRGYGEENDWCQRAIGLGLRNLVAADVFVRHFGSASFRGEKGKRVAQAMKVMAKKHPSYSAQVERFISEDPLLEARRRLDWGRLRQQANEENVLMICHNRGGGAERHLQEDAAKLRSEGKGIFFMRPDRGRRGHIRIQHHACRQLLNLTSLRLNDTPILAGILRELNITQIHSHGLVDFEVDAPLQIQRLSRRIGASLHLDIHDYEVICPRVNLVDGDGYYCGEPDLAGCQQCLTEHGNDYGVNNVEQWRQRHHQVLRAAEKVWVPDPDVALRLRRYYPDVSFTVVPHQEEPPLRTSQFAPISLEPGEKLRVVVIGAIGEIKGYNVLLSCAKDAARRKLPVEFMVMGYTMNDARLRAAGVRISGRYDDREAQALLAKLDPHVVWLPSTWPETYSYTLSIAHGSHYPVAAFDIGAIARRTRERGGTLLFPIEYAKRPALINDQFAAMANVTTTLEGTHIEGFI